MSQIDAPIRQKLGDPAEIPLTPEDAAEAVRAANKRAERATRRAQALEQVLEIGIAVMSEPNLPDLLERILREARRFTHAEAGTLFLREDNTLRFAVAQNDVWACRFGDQGVVQRLRAEPLSLEIPSLAGYVAQTGSLLNIPDAYQIPDSRPYMFQPWWDARNDYQTRSVLAVPLADRSGHVIGVLQLINALDAEGQPVPFDREWELVVQTLASHAVVAIANLRLSDLSFKDPLTNVFNRRYFTLRLDEETKRCARAAQPLAVVGIDIDHFKRVNDCHGHAVGDTVLATVAHLLSRNSRDFTIIARLGGDEFAALLVNTSKVDARLYAERIRRAIESHSFPQGPLTISLGVAALPDDVQEAGAMSGDALMQAADRALYQAKQGGRNRVGCL